MVCKDCLKKSQKIAQLEARIKKYQQEIIDLELRVEEKK